MGNSNNPDLDLEKNQLDNLNTKFIDKEETNTLLITTSKRKKDQKHHETIVDTEQEDTILTKKNKLNEIEEPKPRIVLTFRSEKTGFKSSNVKIISTEEKHDDLSIRKPIRARGSDAFDRSDTHQEDASDNISPKKSKSQPVSESDDALSDSSQQTPKRSTRHRGKEFSENVLANAIARKEKMYDYICDNSFTAVPSQRLTRRIKSTVKLAVNKDLKFESEAQNSARIGCSEKSAEECGIQTRRSARRKSIETNLSDDGLKMTSPMGTAPRRKRLMLKHSKNLIKNINEVAHDDGERLLDSPDMDSHSIKENSQEREIRRLNKLKKKHLSKLGLKAVVQGSEVTGEHNNDESTTDSKTTDASVEHLNPQEHLLEPQISVQESKKSIDQENAEEIDEENEEILEEDPELLDELLASFSEPDTSDEDFHCAVPPVQREVTTGVPRRSTRRDRTHSEPQVVNTTSSKDDFKEAPPRRSKRLKRGHDISNSATHSEHSEADEDFENNRNPKRRSGRKRDFNNEGMEEDQAKTFSDAEYHESNEPAGGDEGSEPRSPEEGARVLGTCYCDLPSNVYITSSEITEPMFCRAVEMIDGVRVGCSHKAARLPDGSLAPLRRAGPRTPYIVMCSLHTAQMRRHMCCAACGIFCTHGIYYKCSKGHLFHSECGLPYGETRQPSGCPHCGFYNNGHIAHNKKCCWVKLEMHCSNRRILLPEQREQCTPAYLSFSALDPDKLKHEPIIPEDLLPSPPVDIKRLFEKTVSTEYEELLSSSSEEHLCDIITNKAEVKELVPLLMVVDLNKTLENAEGGTYMHVAARSGNLTAVYFLHYAGAALNKADAALRTPLMVAILALLDKSAKKTKGNLKKNVSEVDEDIDNDIDADECISSERDDKTDKKLVLDQETECNESLLKVIRYLVAAGCDVNQAGPDGMTALHMAAQYGGAEACSALLAAQRISIDARDHGGWTPLVWAAENKHPSVVRTQSSNLSPTSYLNGYFIFDSDNYRLLLSRGADAAACDTEGNAVLHWCALAGDAASLRLLLDAAAPHALDALNAHGDTPLHVAARQGHYGCVVLLLARGATTDVENSSGELPVEVCSAECRNALTLHTQVALALRGRFARRTLLASDVSNGREMYPIPCINEVDEEPAPADFTYVTRHVIPHRLYIDDTISTNQGCSCKGEECAVGECECCTLGVRRWYARDAPRLAYNFPYHEPPMLFECNQTCECNLRKCSNAIVTRLTDQGSMLVRAQVFRCDGARGWGLRAAAPVARGAPVATYCGELLSVTEADTRKRDEYMFSLDIKQDLLDQCEDKTQLCVDAAAYGSAARFINHSCRPNLAPVRVFTRHRDLRLPTVTLFATRDIKAFEEFTFDYGDKFWSVKSKWMICECEKAVTGAHGHSQSQRSHGVVGLLERNRISDKGKSGEKGRSVLIEGECSDGRGTGPPELSLTGERDKRQRKLLLHTWKGGDIEIKNETGCKIESKDQQVILKMGPGSKLIVGSDQDQDPEHVLQGGYFHPTLRKLQEPNTTIEPHNLMYPIFLLENNEAMQPVSSMPNVFRYGINKLIPVLQELVEKGLKSILLFGIIETLEKDPKGINADSASNPVVQALPVIRAAFPHLLIACDVCLCPYTSHGHCGILTSDGHIDQAASVKRIAEVALVYAKAGAQIIAPSDMMDNRIKAIKDALVQAKLQNQVSVLSYSCKFASTLYGPFRDTMKSSPMEGDRKCYQLPPGSAGLAARAAARDVAEGADCLMVKPGLPYLDIVRQTKDKYPNHPLFIYQVSGEYAMISKSGSADEIQNVLMECLTSMRRAGADCIITYFVPMLLDKISQRKL
ncbi:Delta-aminolevulinic acid dehydratase [Eumeta japonica]|uniref:Delta-aminolevulinic acid dehydratase n=1 Tax=Eumeta variegata TaxID=151549 RepID=A0A4C1T1A7_EUMVA|nr:Delta-aminolevulinic acid dehydratase [Eumeta japonica]